MKKPVNGAQLAEEILSRSICVVQVGAAIADSRGIFSWGWNSSGPDGYGQCAEAHAISRANRRRLRRAKIYIAGVWRGTGKPAPTKPCASCQKLIDKYDLDVRWRKNLEEWIHEGR